MGAYFKFMLDKRGVIERGTYTKGGLQSFYSIGQLKIIRKLKCLDD